MTNPLTFAAGLPSGGASLVQPTASNKNMTDIDTAFTDILTSRAQAIRFKVFSLSLYKYIEGNKHIIQVYKGLPEALRTSKKIGQAKSFTGLACPITFVFRSLVRFRSNERFSTS